MIPQQTVKKLTPEEMSEFLTQMKVKMSQVEGETTMMKNDVTTSIFNNVAKLLSQVFEDIDIANKKVVESNNATVQLQKTLNEIYQGHPDIKIAMESKKPKEVTAGTSKKITK